jgi:hypothetical protein
MLPQDRHGLTVEADRAGPATFGGAFDAPAAGRQFPQQRTHGGRNRGNWPGRPPRQACRLLGERYSTEAGTPRVVRGGPSSVKGTRRSFLTAPQKGPSGPALERCLCRPFGPDGKGQAGGQALQARDEPPQADPAPIGSTNWPRDLIDGQLNSCLN